MKLYLAIIFMLALYTATAGQCGCDEFSREVDCTAYKSCLWASGSCKQRVCDDWKSLTDCGRIEKVGYDDEADVRCYWDGKVCKEYTNCSELTFDVAPTEQQCSSRCKVNATDKKCDAKPVGSCSGLDAAKCKTFYEDKEKNWEKNCYYVNNACTTFDETTACSTFAGDFLSQCSSYNPKCGNKGGVCQEVTCASATKEEECPYFANGEICGWVDSKCAALDKGAACDSMKSLKNCFIIGCVWKGTACVDNKCENRENCPSTIEMYLDRERKPQFCKLGTAPACAVADPSEFTADTCSKVTDGLYRWTSGSKCEACSDKNAYFLSGALLALAAIGIL